MVVLVGLLDVVLVVLVVASVLVSGAVPVADVAVVCAWDVVVTVLVASVDVVVAVEGCDDVASLVVLTSLLVGVCDACVGCVVVGMGVVAGLVSGRELLVVAGAPCFVDI